MKNIGTIALCFACFALGVATMIYMQPASVHAQTATPYQIGVGTAQHSTCAALANVTQYCFAADGLYQSINGGAFTAAFGGGGGVQSFNGRTGNINLLKSDVLGVGVIASTTASTTSTTTATTQLQ